ncbi:hypothetical protein KCU89_g117, partial [Aureobasidium melanogenum]
MKCWTRCLASRTNRANSTMVAACSSREETRVPGCSQPRRADSEAAYGSVDPCGCLKLTFLAPSACMCNTGKAVLELYVRSIRILRMVLAAIRRNSAEIVAYQGPMTHLVSTSGRLGVPPNRETSFMYPELRRVRENGLF